MGKCLENHDHILEMIEDGLSLTDIAARIGTSRHRLAEYLQANSIDYHGKLYQRTGKDNSHWKGGRMIDKDGYVWTYCPGHPSAVHGRYVLEHRQVMECYLGRLLDHKEVVHHKDKNLSNNSLDNLELFHTNGEHLAETLAGHQPNWTPEGLENIRKGVARAVENRRNKNQPLKVQDA